MALQCVVAVRPSSSPAAASTSDPVHTDVVKVVVSWAVRTQSRTRSSPSSARVPTPPGNTTTSGVGSSSNVASTSMPRNPLSERTTPALVADERDVEARDALQHLVRADAVEGGEAGEQRDGDAS